MNIKTLLCGAATLCLLTGTAAAADPIKVGLAGPFTGGSSSMGVSMRDGVKLAVAEINKAGGVLGRQIQLIERDDEAKNELGAQIAQELINKEQVVATLGFINTGVGQASQRFYQDAEIPVLNNVATGTVLTRQWPDAKSNYVFRNAAADSIQSAMIAEEAVVRHGFKKPAILNDATNYGMLGRSDLVAALENLQTRVEGVVTTYDRPFSATDHEAISSNIPVFGLVKGGRVVAAHPEDLAGDKAVRVKPKG